MLGALKASPVKQNPRSKIKFVLATDGETIEAEDLSSDEGATLACPLCGLALPFWLLSAARGHHHRRVNPRERLRHSQIARYYDANATSFLAHNPHI